MKKPAKKPSSKPAETIRRELMNKVVTVAFTVEQYEQIASDAAAGGRNVPGQIRWVYFNQRGGKA